MASLEKLSKALEALKTVLNTSFTPEENTARNKEKVSMVISIADLLCSVETRSAPNFTPHLSFAMETLFYLCDDPDSNVRMVADECLNRIIRALMDGHVGKVNLELHAEIKRNRNARSLRSALVKFAELAQTIRPNKRKVYTQNLVPCILTIAKRKEESVLETLALALSKILVTLGCFMTDNDVKELLQVFLKKVESENAVLRRTAAASILAVCLNCNKSQFFIVHTINTLLESVVPVKEDQNVYTILGILNCIRGLFGHLDGKNTETGLRGSFGQKRKQKKESVLSVDSLIQVFELCLHWTEHEDHNIVTASLETLNELLTTPPPLLLPVLFNHQGLTRSRIHFSNPSWKLSTRTLSDISVATTVPISEDIPSLLESEDFSIHHGDLSTWLEEASNNNGNQFNAHFVLEKERPESASVDTFQDYPDADSVSSDDFSSLLKSMPFQTSEPDIYYARDSPSPPLNTVQIMTWEIGELTDGSQSPLQYAARRIVTRFLIPECGSARVSVRSLALMCLSQVLRLQPTVFFQLIDKNGLSTPKGFSHVCDVICFADDSDQQLRGHTRLLIGHFIHSLFSQALYEMHFEERFEKTTSLESLINILIMGIQDESSVCVRHSLSALLLCLPGIMESSYYMLVTPILNKLLTVTQNPYWLVKVHLIELFCSLPFQCVYFMTGNTDYQSKVFYILIGEFLSSEDCRVRKTACEGISKIVKNLYFPVDYGTDDVVVARGIGLISKMFSATFFRGTDKCMCGTTMEENTLLRVVDILVETLMASSSKNLSYGCIEALCNLSDEYPPSVYPDSWGCRTNCTELEPMSAGGIFSLVVTLLTESSISIDLECHQWLLKLASNIFSGLLFYQLSQENDQLPEKSKLIVSIDELLVHLMRLMYMFVNIIEDNVQSRSLLTSPLKKRQLPRPNSPSKVAPIPVEKENEKDEKIRIIGLYGNIPHCKKLHDIIRSGYTNYKLTLDRVASKKFLSLIRHTLNCLEVMLTPNNIIDSEKMFEELLQYLRISFVLDSEATVKVVHELLRSLFEMNLLGVQMQSLKNSRPHKQSLPNGYYKNIFHKPLVELSKLYDLPGDRDLKKGDKTNDKIKPHPQCDRAVLASRIKLFEGIVIQSLKEYTITCNVKLQAQVLRLLTLLVQLKVNYCLLDSDQIFIQFVLKQFEFLEAGQIHDAEFLIPTIFQFLVHLSNEKNHSKPVISIPKIIQLCDGLMASGQNPVTHSIPALLPVVEHVFFKSTNVTDPKDLETQKEVLLNMLLRLAEYPQVLDTIYNLLKSGRKDEDHCLKWYKQTIDAILPLLSDGRLMVTNINSLHSLFCLSRSFVVPLSSVLTLLFNPQQEGQTFTQWLGMVAVALLSICMYREEEVLLQLEQMNLYVREEGDDPLKVNTVSKTLPPQSLLAKLLFRITVTSVFKLKSLVQCQLKDENIFELEKTFSSFLLCCVLMLQPDNFREVSKSLSILLSDSMDLANIISSFELIMHLSQLPILLWAQLMILLHHSDRNSWSSFMSLNKFSEDLKSKRSLNQELIRRGTIMLYAEYLSSRQNDIDSLGWFLSGYTEDIIWHCHESPIEKLLTSIYNLDLKNKILFETISKCINKMEPVFTYRLLHTLEYIHPDYSGSVLKLVALSLIDYKNIAIARLAAAFCCRTVEYILTSENAAILKEQLTEDELRLIFKSLSNDQKLFKRHSGLISLLNKFGKQCYNISLTEFDDCAIPISAEQIRSVKLDKTWFFNLVKEKCCSSSEEDSHRCAYLLSKLEPADLEEIMSSGAFNKDILKHCFSLSFSLSHQLTDESESENSNSAFHNTAKKILLKFVKVICGTLPSEYQAFDPEKTKQHEFLKFLRSKESMKRLFSLVPAVTNMLNLKEVICDFEKVYEKEDIKSLTSFGVLCIDVINWILFQEKEVKVKHCPSLVQALLKCSSCVFKIDVLSASLSLEQISSICCALLNIFKFMLGEEIVLKEHIPPMGDGNVPNDVPVIAKTAIQMVSMISLIEKNPPNIPYCIFKNARSIIISLGRETKLNWLCRIPVEAWHPPLDSPTPPTLPTMLLHDSDILSQIVSRIRLLGWRGKFQFEESWVCLLGALSPNPDIDNIEQEEVAAIMQANSLAIDGITWLAISTLSNHSNSVNGSKFLHVPRHSNEKLYTLQCWKRLSKMNDLLCKKLKKISGNDGVFLLRIDERPNLERTNDIERYGFAQISVSYLEAQMKYTETENAENGSGKGDGHQKYLNEYGIDIRSCIQFILDLFPQWILLGSGISLNLQFSMIKSVLFISDMFMERSHFEWMLETFLDLVRNHPSHDEIILQYLVIGIAKSCAVLSHFEGEVSDRIFKIIESALKSPFQPLVEAGLHGLLYLLQGVIKIEKSAENVDIPKLKQQEFRQRVLHCSVEFVHKNINNECLSQSLNENPSLLLISLVFYLLEYFPDEIANKQDLIKLLINLVKTTTDNMLYQTVLQGFERQVLLGDGSFNEQITRLALNLYSQSDPKITIPALQLLLACIYASGNKGSDTDNDPDNQQIELMEKVTILFDRIKKGYPVEVEIVCDILPGILADFFSASDILTKVIGEFLSPNQPHKGNMAAMVFQVFSQACSEKQLSLLQDWVVYSLNNLTHNIPVMMAAWSLCCFFISASMNPWLKAIFPIVQSRIRLCEYEDRQILCLAAVDFYQQLNTRQQRIFVESLKNIGSSQSGPFFDILSCL